MEHVTMRVWGAWRLLEWEQGQAHCWELQADVGDGYYATEAMGCGHWKSVEECVGVHEMHAQHTIE